MGTEVWEPVVGVRFRSAAVGVPGLGECRGSVGGGGCGAAGAAAGGGRCCSGQRAPRQGCRGPVGSAAVGRGDLVCRTRLRCDLRDREKENGFRKNSAVPPKK